MDRMTLSIEICGFAQGFREYARVNLGVLVTIGAQPLIAVAAAPAPSAFRIARRFCKKGLCISCAPKFGSPQIKWLQAQTQFPRQLRPALLKTAHIS